MLCAKQVVGWPVVDSEGRELGKVERLVVNDELKLARVLVKREAELSMVAIEDMVFGDHLVWLASGTCFKSLPNGEDSAYSFLLGKEVLDMNGKLSGIAHDFVLDPVQKAVIGLEMSDGLVADWLQGRQVVFSGGLQFDGQRWILSSLI